MASGPATIVVAPEVYAETLRVLDKPSAHVHVHRNTVVRQNHPTDLDFV
jgi:hypothetical protein